MGKLGLAWTAFWRILRDDQAARDWQKIAETKVIEAAPAPSTPEPEPETDRQPDVLYSLILLQREGRLVDFFNEDINGYSDAQIGAAIRQIHAKCKTVLDDTFAVVPILDKQEGEQVAIPVGFDPSAIRLTGNVKGSPPFTGTLVHPGWRAGKMAIPDRGPSIDPTVITPAEVEI